MIARKKKQRNWQVGRLFLFCFGVLLSLVPTKNELEGACEGGIILYN
jgi:hypothetical protein